MNYFTMEQIKSAKTSELVAYYNQLTGKSIKKFQDRATAEKRCAEETRNTIKQVLPPIEVLKSGNHVSAKDVTAFTAAKPRKVGLPGPNSKMAGKRLFKKVTANPRRPGTAGHTSFSVIRDGMSYEEYRLKGGRSNDLAWDIKHDYVEVK